MFVYEKRLQYPVKIKNTNPKLASLIISRRWGHVAKKQEIRTVSFVHIGDELVNTDDLDDDQRRRLATWLKTTYLNTLFQALGFWRE